MKVLSQKNIFKMLIKYIEENLPLFNLNFQLHSIVQTN